jgi:hypothetical protein
VAVLSEILFVVLVLVVAALMAVDLIRTRHENPHAHTDRPLRGADRSIPVSSFASAVRTPSAEPARTMAAMPAMPAAPVPAPAPVGLQAAAAPSFDQMYREASRSAAGEADLRDRFNAIFVNMSHRSQALVERQLRLIDGLERGEQDPQRLASLSKLNRIAMRMYRNSQNLLVVAGNQTSAGWNQPVTLAHLVEVALAEVEDYQRVSFEVQPDIAVRGPAVNDLVHLLVELIENATSFSAAEMPVAIKGHILNTGGALVDITDRGIGMAAKDMAYANQQLDNPPPADIDVPKWMGLLVVSRLAVRHGIRVRLNQSDLGGLTALVWLPDEILIHNSAADPGHLGAQRAAAASPAGFASGPVNMPDALAVRPSPAWSAPAPQATIEAEPAAAVRLSGSRRPDAPSGDGGVVIPRLETQGGTRRLPIFDEVESRWSRGDREAAGQAGAAGLAAAASPAPSGLPRRPSPAVAGPRAVPGTPPATPRRPGAAGRGESAGRDTGQGWAAPADGTDPSAPDES